MDKSSMRVIDGLDIVSALHRVLNQHGTLLPDEKDDVPYFGVILRR